ncbi:CHAT domain-containing protein [Algoriphagus formosus]|uniref:CHAT domain-containing protein n=1 Tax=Algoriphagus formosus TaxID=2007308 RepID=UPI003F6E4BD9
MSRLLFLFFFFLSLSLLAQDLSTKAELESMLENGQEKQALIQIEGFTQSLIEQGKYDSLPQYLDLYGRILQKNFDGNESEKRLLAIHQTWEKISQNPNYQRKLAKSLANWFEFIGNNTAAYQETLFALEWAAKEPNPKQEVLASLYLNLGGLAVKNMDLPAAKRHLAQVLRLELSESDPENVYFANSYLGNIAYFSANLDSAAYYYQETLEAIDQLDPTPRNQFYRKSIILNNLAGVQMAQSDFEAAEQSMSLAISFGEQYMASDLEALDYQKILQDYLRSLDNLAGLYKQMGFYSRAKQLLEFSFRRKSEELGEDDLNTTKSRILLGQVYFDTQDLDLARKYLEDGLERLRQSDQENAYWLGDGLHTLARIEDFLQNEDKADSLYRLANGIFEEEFQGEYDVIYLDFLKNFSLFLAENQRINEAVSLSRTARNYLAEISSDNLYLDYNQALNQAAIYELGNQYTQALQTSSEAFELWNQLVDQRTSLNDSLQAVFQKPQLILIRNRSRYHLENRDVELLKSIEEELLEGLQIIDSQSDFLFEPSDISIQLDLNREYFEFLEQIELELYQISGNESHLDKLLAYHEHARYRQIRSRLQKNQLVRFGGTPPDVQEREQKLKEKLKESLQTGNKNLSRYSQTKEEWADFLDSLRIQYPSYFQLHFETSENVLKRVYTQLNPDITYLRYLHLGKDWWVLAIHGAEKNLIPLDTQGLSKALDKLAGQSSKNSFQPALFHELYQLIWKPAAHHVQTKRVAVIPEGLLFNLSFEALSTEGKDNWSELVKYSLLQDHSFSYQYGLLLMDDQANQAYDDQLVAFAPGFFDQMKQRYQAAFLDRQFLDKSYMQLIPQPFTRRLVEEIASQFDARTFLESGSTVSNFKNEAGKSRIIHLGTHAFSSNVNPNDTHLVFAKSSENPLEPHELFASEIYELDLTSELAVLLACESGKPAYAPGEGMISLAHAFNYAGTKSLLIGLGKIDEKASVSIAEDFYDFLEDGLSKDEALRNAKLNYLARAKGRELDPSFWASLIILGDARPVELKTKSYLGLIFTGILLVFLVLFWAFRKKSPSL